MVGAHGGVQKWMNFPQMKQRYGRGGTFPGGYKIVVRARICPMGVVIDRDAVPTLFILK